MSPVDNNSSGEPSSGKAKSQANRPVQAQRSNPINTSMHRIPLSWVRAVAGLIVIVGIVVGLVFGARSIYHHTHHPSQPAGNNTIKKVYSQNNQTAGNNRPGGNSSSAATSAGQVPNTGPGNVVALFVGASAAAAGLHYAISNRKLAKNRS